VWQGAQGSASCTQSPILYWRSCWSQKPAGVIKCARLQGNEKAAKLAAIWPRPNCFLMNFANLNYNRARFHRRPTIILVSWLVCACECVCVGGALRIVNMRECMRRSRVIKCSAEESIIQHAIILQRHLCVRLHGHLFCTQHQSTLWSIYVSCCFYTAQFRHPSYNNFNRVVTTLWRSQF
jgi:hypothetical protein